MKKEVELFKISEKITDNNCCLLNIFGPNPAVDLDENNNYIHLREKMPQDNKLKDISFCCIGDFYINKLEKFIKDFPDWKFWILTDQPERVKKILKDKNHKVVKYSKPRFNYFDKLLWALDTVMATGRPVLQMDAKRIGYRIHIVENFIDDISMVRALYNKPVYKNSTYFLGTWAPGLKANQVPEVVNRDLRFELNYWDEIIEYMGDSVYDFPPTLEHCTVFSVSKEKAAKMYKDLKDIEPLFRKASTTFKNPYKGVSSGEGLALGWTLNKHKVKTRPLLTIQEVKAHNPIDFTDGWTLVPK